MPLPLACERVIQLMGNQNTTTKMTTTNDSQTLDNSTTISFDLLLFLPPLFWYSLCSWYNKHRVFPRTHVLYECAIEARTIGLNDAPDKTGTIVNLSLLYLYNERGRCMATASPWNRYRTQRGRCRCEILAQRIPRKLHIMADPSLSDRSYWQFPRRNLGRQKGTCCWCPCNGGAGGPPLK